MDWNWFFSSLAQSVAALVGVLGAFLVANLLKNQESYEKSRARTRELLRESEALTDRAKGLNFEGYNDQELRFALAEVRVAVKDAEDLGSPEDYFDQSRFPEYLPKERSLQEVGRVLDKERERRRREAEQERISAAMLGPVGISSDDLVALRYNSTTEAIIDLQAEAKQDRHAREAEVIGDLVGEIKNHVRAVGQHLESVQNNPELSPVVKFVLAAILLLFSLGVIYPLSFLPVATSGVGQLSVTAFFEILFSLRGVLLGLSFVVFTLLIVYLWRLNEGLKHPVAEIENLRGRLNPSSYSEYLQVRIENGIPL